MAGSKYNFSHLMCAYLISMHNLKERSWSKSAESNHASHISPWIWNLWIMRSLHNFQRNPWCMSTSCLKTGKSWHSINIWRIISSIIRLVSLITSSKLSFLNFQNTGSLQCYCCVLCMPVTLNQFQPNMFVHFLWNFEQLTSKYLPI